MRTKKEWLDWFDKLDEDSISNILNKKIETQKTPEYLDNKVSLIFNNYNKKKVKKQLILDNSFFKFALTPIAAIIIIAFIFFIFNYIYKPNLNICRVDYVNGIVTAEFKNEIQNLKVADRLRENSIINTHEKANVNLSVGKKININISEKSRLILSKLYKSKKFENTEIYLCIGKTVFIHNLENNNQLFIETDTTKIKTIGTKFSVEVTDKNNTKIFVEDGKLSITTKLVLPNLENLKKKNEIVYKKVMDIILNSFVVEKDQSFEISTEDLRNAEKEILAIIEALLKSNKEESKNLEEIRNIIESLYNKNEKEKPKEKELFKISRINKTEFAKLSQKNTAVTSDANNLYITSKSNNAVYCVDISKGRMLWKFSDERLLDMTSPAFPFKKNIILGSPDKIFIINKNGEVLKVEDVDKGINFWANLIIINDYVLIPTSQYFYKYDVVNLEKSGDIPEVLGQAYIYYENEKLFIMDSNDKNIKIYDFKSGKIIWTSASIKNRIFSSPVVLGNNVFIADMTNTVYKFDFSDNNKPIIINIDKGVVSNLTIINNNIYFVANNGWLYETNATTFNNPKKILQVDYNPNYNIYLTKKILKNNDELFFCSDTGKLLYYSSIENKAQLIDIPDNKGNLPLISTPAMIGNNIYVIDENSNIYRFSKNE